jgi:GTP-binding nuclear protein Ran
VSGEFDRNERTATTNIEEHLLTFHIPKKENNTDHHCIHIILRDTNGGEKFGDISEYYRGAHAAILMYDLTSKTTMKNLGCWYRSLKAAIPNLCLVVCGNKADLIPRNGMGSFCLFAKKEGVPFFEISVAREPKNLTMPLRVLLEKLVPKVLVGAGPIVFANPRALPKDSVSVVQDARVRLTRYKKTTKDVVDRGHISLSIARIKTVEEEGKFKLKLLFMGEYFRPICLKAVF